MVTSVPYVVEDEGKRPPTLGIVVLLRLLVPFELLEKDSIIIMTQTKQIIIFR